jgi:hypothetical protein
MGSILNPTIFIGSFEWREPITTLTDVLVSLVCLYAVIMLIRYKGERSKNYNYYKAYFLSLFFGMMAAAWLGHGLIAYINPQWKTVGWILSATGHLFFGLASLMQIKPIIKPINNKVIKAFFFTQFSVFVFLIIHPTFSNFIYAQLCSVISLIGLILPMQAFYYFKTKEKGSLIIITAIACSILPGFFFNAQISVSQWFNYHDISHTLMAGVMYIMYLGVSRLSMIGKFN